MASQLSKTVLVTGGTGYIGSHLVVALFEAGYTPVIVDNLSNSSRRVLKHIEAITGHKPHFYKVDVRNQQSLRKVFARHDIRSVIHMAGLKSVSGSVAQPLDYYDTNVGGLLALLHVMDTHGIRQLVYSSSATVYGIQRSHKYHEDMDPQPSTPYGYTKLICEGLLSDLAQSNTGWHLTSLRYFNPIGAHSSGLIGEDPIGTPNNLLPNIMQVASGQQKFVRVFGGDYKTGDGTAIRDYIHVNDLVNGHLVALQQLKANTHSVYNLGTGVGHSVLEVIAAVEAAATLPIAHKLFARRSGDLPVYYADPAKAHRELGWKASLSLNDACVDAWRWQSRHINSYGQR